MTKFPIFKNIRHDRICAAFSFMRKPDIQKRNIADAGYPVSIHDDLSRHTDPMTAPDCEIPLFQLFFIGIQGIIGNVLHRLHQFFFVYQKAFRFLFGKRSFLGHKVFSGPIPDQQRFFRPQPDLLHFFIIHRQTYQKFPDSFREQIHQFFSVHILPPHSYRYI